MKKGETGRKKKLLENYHLEVITMNNYRPHWDILGSLRGYFSEFSLMDRNIYPLAPTLHGLKLSCTFGLHMVAAV